MTTSPNSPKTSPTPQRSPLAIVVATALILAAGVGGWSAMQRATAADQPAAKTAPPVSVSVEIGRAHV